MKRKKEKEDKMPGIKCKKNMRRWSKHQEIDARKDSGHINLEEGDAW